MSFRCQKHLYTLGYFLMGPLIFFNILDAPGQQIGHTWSKQNPMEAAAASRYLAGLARAGLAMGRVDRGPADLAHVGY
jgi:hypothetical protein